MAQLEQDKGTNSITTKPTKDSAKQYTVTIPSFKIPNNPKHRYLLVGIVFILVALVSGVFGGWIETHNNTSVLGSNSLSGQKKIVTSDSALISEIAKSVGQSVVSVNVNINSSGSSTSNTSGFGLFGFTQPEQEQAAGTGIIISSKGLILTNRHVVPAGTTSVSVTLSNGVELKNVSVVGRTSPTDSLDVAFLKINNAEGQKLVPATLGDSAQVQVGDSVVAIGNALGQFQNTVTSGIISGYGRTVTASSSGGSNTFGSQTSSGSENLDDLFQTDAAINEGNSGGPLVNLNGQVIGINTAIAGSAQNIGFSIPINDIKGLINQVLKVGSFQLPYIGIRYIPLTSDVASEYNLSVSNGAFIAPSNNSSEPSILPNSPAQTAGLEVNDVILAVNNVSIDQNHSLTSLIDQYTPGTTISLKVLRNNKTIQANVTLAKDPNN
jgi:S1-C subfamily serine protease